MLNPGFSVVVEIVGKKPKLRDLTIEEDKDGRFQKFVAELIPQCCQESLEEFYINCSTFSTLALLSHTSLKNLSSLSLEINKNTRLAEFWNALGSIDGDRMMPKLEEIELKLALDETGRPSEWPPSNPGRQVHYSYSSVRKLTLDLTFVRVNLLEVKALFPNVTWLEVVCSRAEHLRPSEEFRFWELWRNLEDLDIDGIILGRNYDADFCGINEEEVELLREMNDDEDYLQSVHIVPIRPSLLTMPSEY